MLRLHGPLHACSPAVEHRGDYRDEKRDRGRPGAGAAGDWTLAATRYLVAHQLAPLHRVRLVRLGVHRRPNVPVLAQQHRQLIPQRLPGARRFGFVIRVEYPWIMTLHGGFSVWQRQALAVRTQRLEASQVGRFLELLETRLPVVGHEPVLEGHVLQFRRLLDLYRVRVPVGASD